MPGHDKLIFPQSRLMPASLMILSHLSVVGLDHRVELVRRDLHQLAADIGELRFHLRAGFGDVLLQKRNDRRRRLGRRENADPGIDLETGHAGLGHGRHIRRIGMALRGQDRDALGLPRLDVGQRGRRRIEKQIDAPGQQIGERQRRSAVRHVQHFRAGDRLERRADDMLAGADAGVGELDRAGIGFGGGDDFLRRLIGQRRRADQRVGKIHDQRDRNQVFQRIVRQILVEAGVEHDVAQAADQQRVTVRFGRDRRLGANDGAAARAIFHNERLLEPPAELIGDEASEDVVAARRPDWAR